jgi:hypothetical protein
MPRDWSSAEIYLEKAARWPEEAGSGMVMDGGRVSQAHSLMEAERGDGARPNR